MTLSFLGAKSVAGSIAPGEADGGISSHRSSVILKNLVVAFIVAGVVLANATGYLTPDRPTRDEWERLEKAKKITSGREIYKSNFSLEAPGRPDPAAIGHWGYYNGATPHTVQYDQSGFTLNYGGTAWIGAEFRFLVFQPKRIYRVTLDREVAGEPAALIVRNRQVDINRVQIPVGDGPFTMEFLAPGGSLDRLIFAFIADGRSKPVGQMRLRSLKIELLGE